VVEYSETRIVAAAQQDYDARLAAIRQAEANNTKAQSDVRRYQPLVGPLRIGFGQAASEGGRYSCEQARNRSAGFLAWYFRAFFPRLRQADRYGLFATFHLPTFSVLSRSQGAMLTPPHRTFH
jgi:hypothetical protein